MASDLTFTGERFLPGCTGEIAYEHWHRYAFARRFVDGRRVLDAACGEGYGTALLGTAAAGVVGVDIDGHGRRGEHALRHGCRKCALSKGRAPSCRCRMHPSTSSCRSRPSSTLGAADQPRMLAEFARVLKPDGLLVISSPNKRLYSDARNYVNEFHLHELYRDGLSALLARHFPAQRWYHQRIASWSGIWAEGSGGGADAWLGDSDRIDALRVARRHVFRRRRRAVAGRAVPIRVPRLAFHRRRGHRAEANEANARRGAASRRAADRTRRHGRPASRAHPSPRVAGCRARAHHRRPEPKTRGTQRPTRKSSSSSGMPPFPALEARVAEVARRPAPPNSGRLEAALAAKERIIAYRQSARWWLRLPWLRLRLWLSGRR